MDSTKDKEETKKKIKSDIFTKKLLRLVGLTFFKRGRGFGQRLWGFVT